MPSTILFSCSDKTIEKGKLVIDVKYFFFYVHSETREICGEISCPATGDFVLSHEQTLPGFTPPVRFPRSQRTVVTRHPFNSV
jgi:hypothetical protein